MIKVKIDVPGWQVCYSILAFVSFFCLLQNVINFLNIQMYLLYHCHFVIEKNVFGYTAASEEFLELTKSALLAALEGIMLTTLFISRTRLIF